jgi:hypothetical protein
MNKRFAFLAPLALVGGSAFAALPTEVTAAVTAGGADGMTFVGAALAILIPIALIMLAARKSGVK